MPRVKGAGDTATPTERGNGTAPNKYDAVRQACVALGKKAKPRALRGWIQEHLGMDVATSLISNYKSLLSKARGKGKVGRPRKDAAGAPAGPVGRGARAGGISVDDVKTVKELADRIGADQVKQLAEMLGK